jgi:hypothetical protein
MRILTSVGLAITIGFLSLSAQAMTVLCGATSDTSAPCDIGDTNATGILDLDLDGSLYNVEYIFDFGADVLSIPFAFSLEGVAEAASIVATQALNDHPDIITVGSTDAAKQDFFGVPFEFETVLGYSVRSAEFFPVADGWQATAGVDLVGIGTPSSWAVFTPAVVPVPAAVWLFGSALGLLGWIRKRTTA